MNLKVEPHVKGLIFDIDGTLIDSMPVHLKSWQTVAKTYGFEYPEALFFKNAGRSTGNIVAMINAEQGHHLDPEEIIRAKNTAYRKLAVKIEPIQPVLKIVTEYYGKLPMALGTGEYRDIATSNIKAAGLDKYFSIMVCADDVTHPKPNPETFLKCAELMKVAPEACQVFEDGDLGLEAARRCGMVATDVRPFLAYEHN
jgi:beta-phosphoglucomutase-like phosphatase (HAD superfamily)